MTRTHTSNVEPDDRLVFFPTVGRQDRATGEWLLPIHGWIFRPEEDSRKRHAALAILHRLLRLNSHDAQTELLDRRVRAFLVDNLGDKVVMIRVGDVEHRLSPSAANGHFYDELRLSGEIVAAADELAAPDKAAFIPDRWISYAAVLPPADGRGLNGAVHLLPHEGLSVISDIDDTIKVTHVGRRRKLLRQTFTREFEAVAGMAELYARWQVGRAAFHYVSRSPWQLYEPLAEFAVVAGFPRGAFHLRNFRWREGRTLRPDADRDLKQRIIHEMLTMFPRRRFVLVGDSGERDPEVYADLARAFSEQTQAVLIRNSSGEQAGSERFTRAFDGVDRSKWQVFDDPRELVDFH